MSVRSLILVLSGLGATELDAQGYAGLGQDAPGFALPSPHNRISVPMDLGSHPDFRVEWWYLTASLKDQNGTDFGVQWTLFRTALSAGAGAGWDSPEVWMAHAAVTSVTTHLFEERFARGGTGQAGAVAQPFEAWLDHWRLGGDDRGFDLSTRADGFSYDLELAHTGPMVLHGDAGYSVKSSDGHASHYFSYPFLDVTGNVQIGDTVHEVTGNAWLDREWSSQALSGDQTGWDWAGLALADGSRLMVARVRGAGEGFRFGTYVTGDGATLALNQDEIEMTPLEDSSPPTRWRMKVARLELDLVVVALNQDAWTGSLFQYWEGPVRVEGSHEGVGYLEMTGYR